MHVLFTQVTDTADAEGRRDSEFTWVNDITLIFEAFIKHIKIKIWISRHLKRNNDRCL